MRHVASHLFRLRAELVGQAGHGLLEGRPLLEQSQHGHRRVVAAVQVARFHGEENRVLSRTQRLVMDTSRQGELVHLVLSGVAAIHEGEDG